MPEAQSTPVSKIAADAADHITEARHKARQVLSGEGHIGAVDDWRRTLVSARDTLILIWLAWVTLHGFGDPPFTGYALLALALSTALLMGISIGRSTYSQVQYYATELDRERLEIREDYEHEREEVRALYAAKGFREPLLSQIVDTLCADEDRLLKVMMEEELGLAMYHVNHPIVVGLWNFAASCAAGLILAIPVAWSQPQFAHYWMPAAGGGALLVLSVIAARSTGRSVMDFLATAVAMAVITGAVAYAFSLWLSGFVMPSQTGS
jgi:VIT1/CCC1 family predicted Fe2+/Mn2+ transporter